MEGRSASKAGHGQLTIRETNQILDDLAASFRKSKAKKGKGADKPNSAQLGEDRIKVTHSNWSYNRLKLSASMLF